jgi:predicted short-subunit dehydrogenase-like oxidoreductase (DUF2520 family)
MTRTDQTAPPADATSAAPAGPARRPMPLDGLRVAVVGPGRVGRSLALWCRDAGAELALFLARDPDGAGARYALAEHGLGGVAVDGLLAPGPVAGVDLWLVTVADAALGEVASALAPRLQGARDVVALHAAGCLDATVLAPLAAVGVATGSLHPLRAFAAVVANPGPSPFFAVDGAPAALSLARRLVAAWHGGCVQLSTERRVAYHLAATLAAGGVTTVLAAMAELMRDHDLPAALLAPYLELMRGAVAGLGGGGGAAEADGLGRVAEAITGPAARGDQQTLARHLDVVRDRSPELEPFLRCLWAETRRQTSR